MSLDARRLTIGLNFAAHAHWFRPREPWMRHRKYTEEPYIHHPMEVVGILLEYPEFYHQDIILAAYCHDVLEDTTVTKDELTSVIGPTATGLVLEVTEVSKLSDGNRALRKAMDREYYALASYMGQSLKIADLLSNTPSIIRYGGGFAPKFMQEKEELLDALKNCNPHLRQRGYDLIERWKAGWRGT